MPTDLSPALREAVEVVAEMQYVRDCLDQEHHPVWALEAAEVKEVYLDDATAALRALVEAGWTVTPPEPFKDWGRVG